MEHLPTILISAVIAAIVAAILVNAIRNKKKGKGCSCGSCGGCAMSGVCHKEQTKE